MSGNNTHIEQFYELLPTLWGTEIDFTEIGSDDELKLYATAVVLGSALYEVEHAGNQANPLKAYDLIPLLEQDFQLVPGPHDTVQTRQAAIAAAELLPLGAVASNVVNSIKKLVGAANFKAYVPSPVFPPTVYPASPGAGPGQFRDIRVLPRLVELVDPVATTGTFWCAYQNVDPTVTTPILLLQGDQVVVGAGNTAQMEQVTVLAASGTVQSMCTPGFNYFQAAFTKSHDIGASVTTANYPYWFSTQRLAYAVLSAAASVDRPTRAKVDALMGKLAHGTDPWAIVQSTTTTLTGGTVGPLTIGSPIGTQSVGSVTFVNSM